VFKLLLLGLLLCSCLGAKAAPANLSQTQQKLKALDIKINQLNRVLTSAEDKRSILDKELVQTEKQIQQGQGSIQNIQLNIQVTQQKIELMQAEDKRLKAQLRQQQQLLAQHVRARYQMGEYQAIKWLLNQDDPYRVNRLLSYYQYLIQSRQRLIDKIDNTRKKITVNTEVLHQELQTNQTLHKSLLTHQQQLIQDKKYHTTVLQALQRDILHKQQDLDDFKRDKRNLSILLYELSQQSKIQLSKPFAAMHKRLPNPIAVKSRDIKKTNQGLTFFADEGTNVSAVYPGKVVFSDWLKGYGLLLIIDHGQGFMSLYANNQALFRHKGDIVDQKERIAQVGHSGHMKENGLYFEIRYKGKAVSAREWLA
jgi:septal ring factor EnvC (AmiA/AmiB activator)